MRPSDHPTSGSPRPAAPRRRRRLLAVASVLLVSMSYFVAGTGASQAALPPTPAGWTPIFTEDFNGTSLSGSWRVIEGTQYAPGSPSQFGTGEIERSSASAVRVGGGNMTITATGSGTTLGSWTAARVETNRQDFRPPPGGKLRVEGSLRLPKAPNGQSAGYWPAFWMLGGPYRGNWWNWPMVGEFDIMENVNGANRIWSTVHCGTSPGGPCNEKSGVGNGGPVGCQGSACTDGFHRYGIDWNDGDKSATFYLDGRQTWRVQRGGNIPANIWDQAFGSHGFFIILNIAMGGEMPCNTLGCITPSTGSGGQYVADYVAVYTGPANAPPPPVGPPGGTQPPPPPPPPPPACTTNFALNRPTSASSIESGAQAAAFAVDGNLGTRWSSAHSDNHWWQVDLGQSRAITSVRINWEAAYSSSYNIQTSPDGGSWTTRYTSQIGMGGQEHVAVSATARYVRFNGFTRATPYGHSFWEFEVCGGGTTTPPPPPPGPQPPAPPPPPGPQPPPPPPPPGGGTWAPGVFYPTGAIVTYGGQSYQCRQAHTSQVTWEPPNVLALWLPI